MKVMKSRRRSRCALAIAAAAIAAGVVVGAGLGSLVVRAADPAPIAIIAVDAADWQTIDPLIAAGRLPAFALLKAAAVDSGLYRNRGVVR
jgi:hypothetical protein